MHPKFPDLMAIVLLASLLLPGNAASQGWILGNGANLNGRDLGAVMHGFGDRLIWTFKVGDGAFHNVSSVDLVTGGLTVSTAPHELRKALDALRTKQGLAEARFLTLWVTPDWQPNWFRPREVQAALDAGITPVILDWYFGDGLLDVDPKHDVPPRLNDYAKHSRRLGRFLGQFDGDILIVVEPELNKPTIEAWPEFGELLRTHGIAEIRRGVREINDATGRRTMLFFGVALTDNGLRDPEMADDVYGSKAAGDSYGWTLSRALLEALRPDLDFVGFQQILSQFHRDPEDPSRAQVNSVEALGLQYFPERVVNYARYLKEQLGIPVFIPYVGMATSTWRDWNGDGKATPDEVVPLGWAAEFGRLLVRLRDLEHEMRDAGVIGLGAMMLFDDPIHDFGGYQYLLQNEYALGLVATNARNGVKGEPLGSELKPKSSDESSFVELLFAPR